MGDLHSIPYNGSSSLNLGIFNTDMSHFMDSTPPFFSALDSDLSTGYLQDALFEFNPKRRRLLLFSDDQTQHYSTNPIKSYWNSIPTEKSPENFGCLSEISNFYSNAGKPMNKSLNGISEDVTIFPEKETQDETISISEAFDSSSNLQTKDSNNTQSMSDKETLCSIDHISTPGFGKRKKWMKKRVVYPFAVVKPGGTDDDVTLNDINERILMPPTRPVRHPVGDFACRPVAYPDGPGLSGKAVVALTRIQTKGRGTITIVRTKG